MQKRTTGAGEEERFPPHRGTQPWPVLIPRAIKASAPTLQMSSSLSSLQAVCFSPRPAQPRRQQGAARAAISRAVNYSGTRDGAAQEIPSLASSGEACQHESHIACVFELIHFLATEKKKKSKSYETRWILLFLRHNRPEKLDPVLI